MESNQQPAEVGGTWGISFWNSAHPLDATASRTERNTMSREAFEAWFKPTFYDDCAWSESRNCYVEPSVHMAWKGWQAAIQHACDVAAEIVLRELDDNGQARAINDAIKETLK